MSKIVNLPVKRNDVQKLVDKLKDVIYEHAESKFSVLEVVGALEIVKSELFYGVARAAEEDGE